MLDVLREFDHAFEGPWLGISGEVPGLRLLPGTVTRASSGLKRLPLSGVSFYPAVECFTRDKELVLRAELPGVDPKDVEVDVAGDQLTIRGEKKHSRQMEEGSVWFREVAHGRFERTFTLPEGVKADQIKASHSNGVLEVTIPAESVRATRQVPIEAAESDRKAIKAA